MEDIDLQIRLEAFKWLTEMRMLHGDILEYTLLHKGFSFRGSQVHMIGQTGIWKPKLCHYPISVMTSTKGIYDDQYDENDDFIVYKYRGIDPNHSDNVALRNLRKTNRPLVYYKGVERGRYAPIYPTFIHHDDPNNLQVYLQVEERQQQILFPESTVIEDPVRRYMTTQAKRRLHQQEFRDHVLRAYDCKCAFCRIKHLPLLDAAHIIPDNEIKGEPIVKNGLALCKIHHAAFDANIMGVNSDYKIVVKEDILREIDGPMLKHGIIELHNEKIILPRKKELMPDKERLEMRFDRFLRAS